jgi:hypothetical protein
MNHTCGSSHRNARRAGLRMSERGGALSTKLLDDEPGVVPVAAVQADDEMSSPTEEQISELAYSYWEARGGQGGSPWEDWFRAEQELKGRREL